MARDLVKKKKTNPPFGQSECIAKIGKKSCGWMDRFDGRHMSRNKIPEGKRK
jgi:hypothetical protein